MSCALCGTAGAIGDFSTIPGQSGSIPKHLITSNVPPLDSQIPVFRRLLAESQDNFGVLNARIDALQAALTRLVRERDDLVMRCKEVLAPVRRIPAELVIEIFSRVRCTRIIKDGEDVVEADGHRLPFTMVLLQDHSLTNTSRPYFPPAMIQTQLSRTGSVPLHIHYDWRDEHSGQFGEEAFIWNILLPHSDRWQALHIRCASWDHVGRLDILLKPVKRRLAGLTKVEFIVNAHYWNSIPRQWDLFSAAPRLSTVLLTASTYNEDSPNAVIPWSQITRYRGCYGAARQLDILRSCTHLVECSVVFNLALRTPNDIPLVLPHLLRLHVYSGDILTYITAPVLEELLIKDIAPTLAPFLERSCCRLTTLILRSLLSIDDLIPLLTLCPSLEHFTFILSEAYAKIPVGSLSTLFNALALQRSPAQTSDIICPGLTSLTFGWWSLRGSSWKDAFFAMIRSRAQRLRVVRVLSLKVGGNDFAEELRTKTIMTTDEKDKDHPAGAVGVTTAGDEGTGAEAVKQLAREEREEAKG
ncbi:hypothetical protein FB45DRAFT_1060398 [Roridomyces roridus]|uniref:F-box domain-containing protein n=1 Tax=Roridomyces roridus TaxID=1738132 RepID=A0AAD7FIF2_9AGAR|nr:hypothetical protein FB45DRAFT_1060398 [Roridomyces roridus]